MSETFRCDDKDTLVAYLYGEIDGDGRREVERHLRGCAACTDETEELQSVRHNLEAWLPPEPDLGFTIVQKSSAVLRPSRWASVGAMPAWAQVAAAALLIAAGAAIANVQVRSSGDGWVVSTGWIAPVAAVAAPPTSNAEWRAELTALEQNLRREFATRSSASVVSAGSVETHDSAAILRRVEAMLARSEQRQRDELAMRLVMAERDWNVRRQTDLMNITQTLGRLQRGAQKTEAGQQDLVNYIRRVTSQPIP